ncbi:hypothetical protein BJ546DRAFT_843091 [Cryomyces antarcticus]
MSRTTQDQFIDDDEEETCPLCVEEFDLSDKNFRPCPCGYQICQFCYNNIKTTMNGLCPACRRPYDDKNIEWKVISPEEMAIHKAEIAQQAKKKAAARQKEAQKREADNLSRKHLAGLRVVQKNLVYITGLSPTIQQDKLLETLRGDQYFGQYGKIVKIVVSKAKDSTVPQQSVGVYVTFARKQDAASCIAAVDGTQNSDRTLRAQYGTTKYCSAYLRNETCNNRNCMFLHEPGEENESFTRQDLSSMNVISTQQPTQVQTSSPSSQPAQPQPPSQSQQPVASAAQPMARQDSNNSLDGGEGPALPSTASWAAKSAQAQLSQRMSRAASGSSASPALSTAAPATQAADAVKSEPEVLVEPAQEEKGTRKQPTDVPALPPAPTHNASAGIPRRHERPDISCLADALKTLATSDFRFVFSSTALSPEDMKVIQNYPPLFDPNGGAKRRMQKKQQEEEEERLSLEAEARLALQGVSAAELDENMEMSGSLQLGGEPEERQELGLGQAHQHAIQPPGQSFSLGNDLSSLGINGRGLTPQQQQELLLQQFKQTNPSSLDLLNSFQHQPQPTAFQNQGQQSGSAPGHARNTSRFSFANDTASASASVKPVANTKLMSQQSSMMPSTNGNHISNQHQPPFYSSGMQGPPPGLKATGTPPVSGGGMFGQGHGFATGGLNYGANLASSRNANEEMMRELLRGRGQMSDAGKREYMFSSFLHQHPQPPTSSPAPGLPSFPYGSQPGASAFQDVGSSKPKKKGKKHRHANTSSSGGGVVDVADPSILQARLHQGGAAQAAGQGLYSGQGQGGFNSMMYAGSGFGGRW